MKKCKWKGIVRRQLRENIAKQSREKEAKYVNLREQKYEKYKRRKYLEEVRIKTIREIIKTKLETQDASKNLGNERRLLVVW